DPQRLFAIKTYSNDVMYLSKHYKEIPRNVSNDCFLIAAAFSSIHTLKYIYSNLSIDPSCRDKQGNDFFLLGCMFNQTLDMLDGPKIDPGIMNYSGDTCLTIWSEDNPERLS